MTRWVVKSGDPGQKHVSTLSRLGFDTVVLPRAVYLVGTLPERLPPLPDLTDKDLPFKLRERDCLYALGIGD